MKFDLIQTPGAVLAGIPLPIPDGGEKSGPSDFARVFSGMLGNVSLEEGMAGSPGMSGMTSGQFVNMVPSGETGHPSGTGGAVSASVDSEGAETIAMSQEGDVVRQTVMAVSDGPKAATIASAQARVVSVIADGHADDSAVVEAPIVLFEFPAAASGFIPEGKTDAGNGSMVVPARIESVRFEEDGEVLVFTAAIANTSLGAEATVTFAGAANDQPDKDSIVFAGSTVEIGTDFGIHIPSGAGAGMDDGAGMPAPSETVSATETKIANVQFTADMRPATDMGIGGMINDTIPVETAEVDRNAAVSGTESAAVPVAAGIMADGMTRTSTEYPLEASGGPHRIRIEFVRQIERTDGAIARNDMMGNASDASSRAAVSPENATSAKSPVVTAVATDQTSPAVVNASSESVVPAGTSGAAGAAQDMTALLLSFAETGSVEAVFRIAPEAAPNPENETVGVRMAQKTVTVQPVENETVTVSSTIPIEGNDVPKQPMTAAAGSSMTEPPEVRERMSLRIERMTRMRDTVQTERRVFVESSVASESAGSEKPAISEATVRANESSGTSYSGETVAVTTPVAVNRTAQIKPTVMNTPAPEGQAISTESVGETAFASTDRVARSETMNVTAGSADDQVIPEGRVVRMYSRPGGIRSAVADSETIRGTVQPSATENEKPVSISRPIEPVAQSTGRESASGETVDGSLGVRVKTATISKNASGAEARIVAGDTSAVKEGMPDTVGSKSTHTVSTASVRVNTSDDSGSTAVRPDMPDTAGTHAAVSDRTSPSLKVEGKSVAPVEPETVTTSTPDVKERPRPVVGISSDTDIVVASSKKGASKPAGAGAASLETPAPAPKIATNTVGTDADGVIAEPRDIKSGETLNNNVEPVKILRSGSADVRAGSSDEGNTPIPLSTKRISSGMAERTAADTGASEPAVVSASSGGEMDTVTARDDRIRLVRIPGNAVDMESGSPSAGNPVERGTAPTVRRVAPATNPETASTADASPDARTIESERSASSARMSPSQAIAGEETGIADVSSRATDSTTAAPAFVPEAGTKSGRRAGSATSGTEDAPSMNTAQQEIIDPAADGSAPSTGDRLMDQRGGETRDTDAANMSAQSDSASGEQTSVFEPIDRQVRSAANDHRTSRREPRMEKDESRSIAASSSTATNSGRDADVVSQVRPVSISGDMNTPERSRVSDASGNTETVGQTISTDTGSGLFAAGTEKTGMTQDSRRTAETTRSGNGMSRYHDIESGVMTTVVRQARILLQNRQSSATVVLDPPSLGRMTLDIVTENAKLTGKITVESREVQDIIRSNIADLRQTLAQSGFMVESFDVQVGHNGGTDSWARREDFENLAAMVDADRKVYGGEASVNEEYSEPAIASGWSAGTVDIWI